MGRTAESRNFENRFIQEVSICYRTTDDPPIRIAEPKQVADFVRSVVVDNSREHGVALYLDSANQIVCYSIVSIGGFQTTLLSPRELFQRAVLVGAVSVILAHNHPSGGLAPSEHEKTVTERIKNAGQVIGIGLIDHVIFNDHGFYSFRHQAFNW